MTGTEAEALSQPISGKPLTWPFVALLAVFYLLSVVVTTYPTIREMGTTIPEPADPLNHLWVLRWNKQCLLEGKLPFVCPEIQYPVGAPLGNNPSLILHSLIFLPLSMVIDNDVFTYNLMWFGAFVFTGLGTFALAWVLLRERWSAAMAGLLAIMNGPMMFNSHGWLENITMGVFPIFAACWMRWIDQPSRGRLAAVLASYFLLAISAPYWVVFVVFPASLYILWSLYRAGRPGYRQWLRSRITGLASFAILAMAELALIFSSSIWAVRHGYPMDRPAHWFFATDFWSYLVPAPRHFLFDIMPPFHNVVTADVYSYLGLVMLGLLLYAAVNRVRVGVTTSYWWLAMGVMLVISLGGAALVGSHEIPLPARWLRDHTPILSSIRVPGRLHLWVAICGALIAGAAAGHLAARFKRPSVRAALLASLALVAVADSCHYPYERFPVEPMPGYYKKLLARDPDANLLEAPVLNTGNPLAARLMFWQSYHGGRTSAGYTANFNALHEALMVSPSPFYASWLADPGFLANPEDQPIDLSPHSRFDDYTWLYLTAHHMDYVVLHRRPQDNPLMPPAPMQLDRLINHLRPALVSQNSDVLIYDRARMPAPTKPVSLCTTGFMHRFVWDRKYYCMVDQTAKIAVYNPTPDVPLRLVINANAMRKPRVVRLKSGPNVLATWTLQKGAQSRDLVSPPLKLPQGIHELVLESDGTIEPPSIIGKLVPGVPQQFSFLVTSVELLDEPQLAAREGRTIR